MIGKYLPLLASSLRRKRLRTFFTVASILIAFLLYGLAASMQFALQSGVDVAGADRLLTMHKVSFTQLLPASYESRIKAVDGVVAVSPQTWFGAWFRDERNQFPTFPSDPEAYLRIYPEIKLSEEQKQAWFADRTGALVGRAIADVFGWKVGDQVPLKSAIWRREDGSDTWDITVRAIYDLPEGGDTRQVVLHQEYFEEAKQQAKGLIGWYVIKISDVNRAQVICQADRPDVCELAGGDQDVVGTRDGAVVRQPGRQHRGDPVGDRRGGVLHDAAGNGQHHGAVGA